MKPTLDIITATVADAYGFTIDDLRGPSRGPAVVHARHVAMWFGRGLTNASLPELARAFGRKDHTTVLHACRKMTALVDGHPERYTRVRDAVRCALDAADRELSAHG